MVKKLKAMADKKNMSGASLFDSALASSVKESAKEIWLAGMGAFAKAQAEGRQVFEALVKEGSSLQKKTQGVAEEKFGEVTSRMTSMADEVTAKAGKQWDKLETIFEDRTAKALKKLGVPTSKDMQALMDRVDALSAKVATRAKSAAKSAAKTAPAKTAAPKKRATAKAAAKRAPRKAAA
ncbi:MAG: phasin family protein [Burkholderiales bacterium]|nr:phasin family protein [Burkholderiales bacterium]